MAVQPHQVSRGPNDGSRDDMQDNGYDEFGHKTRDKRAETQTTYLAQDIEKHCTDERYANTLRRALRFQEGEHANGSAKSRGTQNHEEDQRRIIGTFASQLGLTSRQKERVEHLVMDVMSVNSFGRYSMEQVTLATINVVVREDGRWIEDEEQFRDYMQQVGLTDLNTLKRLRELVRERIPSKP